MQCLKTQAGLNKDSQADHSFGQNEKLFRNGVEYLMTSAEYRAGKLGQFLTKELRNRIHHNFRARTFEY